MHTVEAACCCAASLFEDMTMIKAKVLMLWCFLQDRIIKSKAVVPTKFSWVFNKEIPVIQV